MKKQIRRIPLKVKLKQFIATVITITMVGSLLPSAMMMETKAVKAATVDITEDFNDYNNILEVKGSEYGSPSLSLSDDGINNSKALQVSNREHNYYAYAYDVSAFAGNTIKISAEMAIYEAEDGAENQISATLKTTKSGADDEYNRVAYSTTHGKDYSTLSGTYDIPEGGDSYLIYFEAPESVNYLLDDVSITVEGNYKAPDEKNSYVDTSEYAILKDLYKDYFKVGVVAEALSSENGANPLNEIGNNNKEALIKQEFNSLTLGKELSPDCNMGYNSEGATDTNLPFVIDSSAKEMLDWANENHIKVRGHVLVWHSQTPDAIFCKDYSPEYKDGSKKELDSCCYVDRNTMLSRLESYINNTMQYMYANGYGTTIYAWDVVNEAVELGANEYNLRESYWYKIIGPDFVYYAFKYTKDAIAKYSKEHAANYGLDSYNEASLKSIQPKLFYNDYNEYQPSKRDAINRLLTDKINGHSIKAEGLIDGVGMQAHIRNTTDIDKFIEALREYGEAIGEVHITELDVTQSTSGVNADYYQAMQYNALFKALIGEVTNGVNLTSVTISGLTDDNSRSKESSPLLFRSDLSKKMSFDGIVNAITGDKMPEPAPDFSDMNMDFETVGNCQGFEPRGDGQLTVQSDVVYKGNSALLDSGRQASWNGVAFDVSRFKGQTIAIKVYVKTNDKTIKLGLDGATPKEIAQVSAKQGEWTEVCGEVEIPSNYVSVNMYLATESIGDFYVDDISVRIADYVDDVEGNEFNFTTRWNGAGEIAKVVNENGNHSAVLKNRDEVYYGIAFDVSQFLGMKVEISLDVKTDDKTISMKGDINDEWPTYIETASNPGKYKTVQAIVNLPKNLTTLRVYIDTDGRSDIYVDNLKIRRVMVDEEEKREEPTEKPSSGSSYSDYTPASTTTPTTEPTVTPIQTPTVKPTVTPSSTPEQTAAPTLAPSQKPTTEPTVKPTTKIPDKGTTVTDKNGTDYKVISNGKAPTVAYKEPAKDAKGTVNIPSTAKVNGVTYKVTEIAPNTFKNNKEITKVDVGSNVKTIGKNAFSGCANLKTISFGKNVSSIGSKAFLGCSKLKTIIIKSTKLTSKNVSKTAFKGISKNAVIKVPASVYKKYKELFRKKGLGKKVTIKKIK